MQRDNKYLDGKCAQIESSKDQAMSDKMVATNAVSALTREIEWVNKETAKEQNNIHNLIRDRDMMKKSLAKVEEVNIKNKDDLARKQNFIQTL